MRRKDDEKQKSIKRAVVKIVLQEGMHGASISKIAKAAGVSPATVYIYYDNKDVMLKSIYHEYAEQVFQNLLDKLHEDLPGNEFVDLIIREYYNFMVTNEEVYHFVEQFSSCPSLNHGCTVLTGPELLNTRIKAYREAGIFYNYDNSNIWAMLFYPVKGIAKKSCGIAMTKEQRLDEMIHMIQRSLLQ